MPKVKPISVAGKLFLNYMGKTLDDFSKIDTKNVFGNYHRINLFEGEKIIESYWASIIDGKIVICERD